MLHMLKFRHKVLVGVLCLIFVYGCMCFFSASTCAAQENRDAQRARDYDSLGFLRDNTNPATVVEEQGNATTGEDIGELNIGNNLTVTYKDGQGNLSSSLRILLTITLITLAPTLIIMMTSFTRILIVMHFTRAAMGTQTAPPNQVMIGLTLFLTFFIMSPVINQINTEAYQPLEAGEITQAEFFEKAMDPIRDFMYKQTKTKDVNLFLEISHQEGVETLEDIPNAVLIPAFMISELRTAFIIGFLIYIPFIVIDMVVASTLMSMGMMMLPPTTISMPFKILLFVLADGWNLIIGNLVRTFY